MRIERLTLAMVLLAVGAATPGALAQGPRPGKPQVEVRSLFGTRTLGWPVTPKSRQYGGSGTFGPRPELGRGFSPRPSWSLVEDFPPQPASPNRYRLGISRRETRPAQSATRQQPPADPTPQWTVSLEQDGAQPEQVAEEMTPAADQAEGTAALPGESLPGAEPLSDQPGQAAGQPGELAVQPEGSVATSPEAPVSGIPGEVGSGIPVTPLGGRPSFQWDADSLRMVPAESRLAERLRGVLRNRLRAPLGVSIEHETAILRGAVASEYDRTLAGHLARFEPGVRNVKNELTVAPAAFSPNARAPMLIRLSPE